MAKRTKPKTFGYCRVSKSTQDADNQRLAILNYSREHKLRVDDFLIIEVSSRKSNKSRRIDELMACLQSGDTLIVAELSRLGRSVGELASIVDELVNNKIRFIAIKEGIFLTGNGEKNIQTTVLVSVFSMLAEVERSLISERTKDGLRAAQARGKILGRPKGSLGKSKLDGKEEFILSELKYRVSMNAISRKLGCSMGSLVNFINTRKLRKQLDKTT